MQQSTLSIMDGTFMQQMRSSPPSPNGREIKNPYLYDYSDPHLRRRLPLLDAHRLTPMLDAVRSLNLRTCVEDPRLAQAMTRGKALSPPPSPRLLYESYTYEDQLQPDEFTPDDAYPTHDAIVRFYWALSGEAVRRRENTYLHAGREAIVVCVGFRHRLDDVMYTAQAYAGIPLQIAWPALRPESHLLSRCAQTRAMDLFVLEARRHHEPA